MRYSPTSIALVVAIVALLGCGTSPTAPEPTGPPQFDPAVLFARLAGSYTLTFEADESCPLPPALRVLTYDAVLEPTRYRYLGVRVASNPHVVGDLWVLAREEEGFTLRWNVDCETPDAVGATSFYLCGQGPAYATDDGISGVLDLGNMYLDGDRRSLCPTGSHRFIFRREH